MQARNEEIDSRPYALWRFACYWRGWTWHYYALGCDNTRKLMAEIKNNDPKSVKLEGIAGYAFRSQVPGTVPFYRAGKIWFDSGNEISAQPVHLLTADRQEFTNASTKHGYKELPDRIAAYVYPDPGPGRSELLRSFDYGNLDFFYTTDRDEHLRSIEAGWNDGGTVTACYLLSHGDFCFPEETVGPPA